MRPLVLIPLLACPKSPEVKTSKPAPDQDISSITTSEMTSLEAPTFGEEIWVDSSPQDLTPEDFRLPATVLLPEGDPNSAPCLVLLAGSGPTDRDWTSPLVPGKNGSARQLAEALYQEGIGSIRYDKAAIAESEWPIANTHLDLYRDEALLAWRYMTDQTVCGNVSFLGNSEGSIHSFRAGVMLQKSPQFGGIISLSGPAMSILDTVKVQLKAQLPPGTDMAPVDEQLDDLESRIRQLPEMDGPPLLSLIPGAASIWMSAVNPLQGQLVRDLLLFEPLAPVGQYTGPALILSADHDIQCPHRGLHHFLRPRSIGRLRKRADRERQPRFHHETRSRRCGPPILVLAYPGGRTPAGSEGDSEFLVALSPPQRRRIRQLS